ncbi:hypothetical protein AU490_10005 [Lonsdalea populi]|uniref:Uncharacterized protein n=3 Tax=Lonsdalea TaxID=1082702 RepID=A0ACD1JCH6_9GAMM|nr:hypothetical protein AU508_13720 [Lonsdalea populi]RAT13507.1 hypothetical protein AU485_08460 [Lonsdalea quercina]OSN01750.1 hypothetical protein AU499_05315 [Lonsdalea populi]RAT17209.1 hypothetical protein AU486_05215 [Lonsdalea quercina]RAT21826.1 hypothetical protein AU487_05030 [Lonsdalea populi]
MMLASTFVPLVHLDEHPMADREAIRLKISLSETIETFLKAQIRGSERLEICHDERRLVVSHGWSPIAAECQPGEDGRVIAFAG